MSDVFVELRYAGGTITLLPGDTIGRGPRCTLTINAPEISELHGLVSLRGGTLQLLGLRGPIVPADRRHAQRWDLPLRAGERIRLSAAVTLAIERVEVPPYVLAVTGLDGRAHPLLRQRYWYSPDAGFRATPPANPTLTFWHNAEGWFVREGRDGVPARLSAPAGDEPPAPVHVADGDLRLVRLERT